MAGGRLRLPARFSFSDRLPAAAQTGASIYTGQGCNGCHGNAGTNSPFNVDLAPLSDNIADDEEKAIRVVLGLEGGKLYAGPEL